LHAELELGDWVTLLGDVSLGQLVEEYASADIFCLPSVQEGFGIVFLEAMAARLPVVACRAAAVPEVVSDSVTGRLVTPRDPASLADALEHLLVDTARAARFGLAGRERVIEFTPRRVAESFLEAVRSKVCSRS